MPISMRSEHDLIPWSHKKLFMATEKKLKKTVESINSKLALVMKSGKYSLGYKSTIKSIIQGKSKLVIISANCPPLCRSKIEYFAMLSRTNVHHYSGNNIDLGTACGKYFRCSCLSITEAGDSDIIDETPALTA
jgi:large subunit ribosomal protein L30e